MTLHRAYPQTVEWMKLPTSKFSLRCEGEYKELSNKLLGMGVGTGNGSSRCNPGVNSRAFQAALAGSEPSAQKQQLGHRSPGARATEPRACSCELSMNSSGRSTPALSTAGLTCIVTCYLVGQLAESSIRVALVLKRKNHCFQNNQKQKQRWPGVRK